MPRAKSKPKRLFQIELHKASPPFIQRTNGASGATSASGSTRNTGDQDLEFTSGYIGDGPILPEMLDQISSDQDIFNGMSDGAKNSTNLREQGILLGEGCQYKSIC